MQLNSKY